jgi:hypothetical protein
MEGKTVGTIAEDRAEAIKRYQDAIDDREFFRESLPADWRDWTPEQMDEYDRLSKAVENALYYL